MEELIKQVVDEKMKDGSIIAIVSKEFDQMINEICRGLMGWNSKIYQTAKEKIEPILLQAVEASDLGRMTAKITALLNESLQGSELDRYGGILDGFKNLYNANDALLKFKERRCIALREIFDEFKHYAEDVFDRGDFDDDEINNDERYESTEINCTMTVSKCDKGFMGKRPDYIVELICDKSSEKKSADIRFRLSWGYDNTRLFVSTDLRGVTLSHLRLCPPFILFLLTLENRFVEIQLDENEMELSATTVKSFAD